MPHPFISICIPAYQRVHLLKRLLDSIAQQTFKDFEVVISDDSRDDSVEKIIGNYRVKFKIQYFKNVVALDTPANWNKCIREAEGEWIKIMHDDDWFATPQALQQFAEATKRGKKFIVSGYNNINDNGNILSKKPLIDSKRKAIIKTPMLLLSNNYIGQPSVCLVHRSIKAEYDERMKWRVDIDFYMQILLSQKEFLFLPDVLINLGISASSVTNSCLNVPGVELPEGWLLIEKYGSSSLQNIWVYDAWWRILRNTNTRSKKTLYQYAFHWPEAVENMVEAQSKIDATKLKKGIFSKWFMLKSYVKERSRKTNQ